MDFHIQVYSRKIVKTLCFLYCTYLYTDAVITFCFSTQWPSIRFHVTVSVPAM